ncbi:MAG: 16S rRNA (adenine(1518)-N(6)/adenine(1519)-N(6))-dimethyltransferase RsmA [Candidatus Saccharimonadales bacterium]
METKKSLGQHWLHDDAALEAMVSAAGVQAGDTVLEIGPGLGTLTAKLLAAGARVHCVEFDEPLIPGLQKKFGNDPGFSIEQNDILRFDFTRLPAGYKVVANIPYYLTSNLLRLMCESPNPFSRSALLMQKEVAERVVASPGSMSILSVSVQFYCEVSLGEIVPAALFTPPPKVDSQILKLTHRTKPLYEDTDTALFFRLVKAGFSEKRKMLRSSLSGGLGISKLAAGSLCQQAGIDPSLRAQALSLEDWHRLYLAA